MQGSLCLVSHNYGAAQSHALVSLSISCSIVMFCAQTLHSMGYLKMLPLMGIRLSTSLHLIHIFSCCLDRLTCGWPLAYRLLVDPADILYPASCLDRSTTSRFLSRFGRMSFGRSGSSFLAHPIRRNHLSQHLLHVYMLALQMFLKVSHTSLISCLILRGRSIPSSFSLLHGWMRGLKVCLVDNTINTCAHASLPSQWIGFAICAIGTASKPGSFH